MGGLESRPEAKLSVIENVVFTDKFCQLVIYNFLQNF